MPVLLSIMWCARRKTTETCDILVHRHILCHREEEKQRPEPKQNQNQTNNNKWKRMRHEASDLIKYLAYIRANDNFLR